MKNKENQFVEYLGHFYQDVLGSKSVSFSDNYSMVLSGVNLPSFNISCVFGNLDEKELEIFKKTWSGPMILITDMEKNFTHQKVFYSLGFQKRSSFPILYKKLNENDFIWGQEQTKNVKDLTVKKVKNEEGLDHFCDVVSNVFKLKKELILESMNKDNLTSGESNLYVGYHKKNPISTLASLNYESKSFIWNMSILPEFRKLNFMKKMGYKMFEDNFKKNILDTYTFPTTEETEGLFKKMGANNVGSVYLWVRQ